MHILRCLSLLLLLAFLSCLCCLQVYTYVLQPLTSGQDGITSGNSKSEGHSQDHQQQQLKQLPPQQQQQPEQQQPEQQQAQIEWLRQQQQLALQIVQGAQGAPAAAAAAADGASPRSAELLQQQQQHNPQVSSSSPRSNLQLHASSRHTASCNDSSQSLTVLQEGRSDLSKLPPEVAAAAAAALPAAAAASAAVQSLHAGSTASSRQHGREIGGGGSDSSSDGGEASQHKSVLVGWELRLVMEFCDAVSDEAARPHNTCLGFQAINRLVPRIHVTKPRTSCIFLYVRVAASDMDTSAKVSKQPCNVPTVCIFVWASTCIWWVSSHEAFSLIRAMLLLLLLLLQGSLRTALDHKLLIDRTTGLPALECVLFLAHDVACAMIHLHSEHLLHGDLKASNVSCDTCVSQ
jgi:hypothetical protein